MIKILVVEDELPISNLIKLNLNMSNYECKTAFNGEDALEEIENDSFDLILLDVMLPKIDGFTLLEKIKPLGIPVIFLTAKTSVTDKVYGLRAGADDYITKPFEGIELLARIDNVLRHYNKNNNVINFEDVEINLKEMTARKAGEAVELTLKEFELLVFLVQNKNVVLTREKLIERVWGYDYVGETRTIDNHIQKLRKKLQWKDKIKTVFKLGYRLEG
ncbi:response regulator transcription factor [Clostridium autoethanogenum]|uniref:Stage 0 sporulation protein A homolog n=1 Tax=Clostridium autoethanogenum DSM 10061 TaxID=1341692 RepID=A0ABN4BEG7_9CLOT|nr:response regulator transcription factor [Clostridium autoethanogenum]AGY74296.1 response regulator transcription factor [Clostridium autoethanogenum DSM 10061]ALU34487.1 Two component transcriptional regulator winged helix family [Clostridium autoethanogenum DSM 10061]OVY51207.1 Transcriptional regulatory protein WalR [Clostridium autoethanogenum]